MPCDLKAAAADWIGRQSKDLDYCRVTQLNSRFQPTELLSVCRAAGLVRRGRVPRWVLILWQTHSKTGGPFLSVSALKKLKASEVERQATLMEAEMVLTGAELEQEIGLPPKYGK